MSDQDELSRIRTAVDEADDALASALDARARAVKAFVALRTRNPDGYYTLTRAAEVLNHVRDKVRDFPGSGVEAVLREVSRCDACDQCVTCASAEGLARGRAQALRRVGPARSSRRSSVIDGSRVAR